MRAEVLAERGLDAGEATRRLINRLLHDPSAALRDLEDVLRALPAASDAEAIQNAIYEVGKRHPFAQLRDWFGCLYQVLLGQQEGPRFGQFVALYGIAETIGLIEQALARPADAA